MAFTIRATASQGGVHLGRPGLYDAFVTDVRRDHLTGAQFGSGDVARFYCRVADVLDESGDPVIIDAIANLLLSPMSKLWGWLEALGMHPEIGVEQDLEEAVGKACVLSVVDNVRDGVTYSRVEGIFPARNAPAAGLPAPNLLTPTGEVNWTGFWAECTRRHISRDMVSDYLNGDLNQISAMPVGDVLGILENLSGV
jgi:hypothetical protein